MERPTRDTRSERERLVDDTIDAIVGSALGVLLGLMILGVIAIAGGCALQPVKAPRGVVFQNGDTVVDRHGRVAVARPDQIDNGWYTDQYGRVHPVIP